MADNIRVIDCLVDELQANLNALKDQWQFASWNWYETVTARRVTVVLIRLVSAPVAFPGGLDLRGMRRN